MIDGDGRLQQLERTAFVTEDVFQELLARFPAVLRGAAGGGDALLLVRREAPVPGQEGGSGRWSLDHLFIDREGVPVLVEVKRASDTRNRREVVAQMLDYAANGVAFWPAGDLLKAFQATATAAGDDPDAVLDAFIEGSDAEAFWRQVDSNLRSGRVRLVFVADEVPKELRRIVEFLNEQMRPAEVLAIEVEHFTSPDGVRLLSPKLLGATERASTAKAIRSGREPMDEAQWFDALAATKGEAAAHNGRRLAEWLRGRGWSVTMTESQDALATRLPQADARPSWPFFLRRSTGRVELSLQYLSHSVAYGPEVRRAELLARFKAIPGVQVATAKLTGWPSAPLASLDDHAVWTGVTDIFDEVAARLAESSVPPQS